MTVINRLPVEFGQIDNCIVFSDFIEDQADVTFIDTLSDLGSVTIGDVVNGIMAIVPSDGTVTDNDESYASTPNAIFKFANNKPHWAAAFVQFTEANTNTFNAMFGFMDAIGANSLVDDGGGPKATFSGAVIYKVDGGTVWRCCSSNGTTRTDSVSTTTAGGAAYQKLEIVVSDDLSTRCKINYKVDGQFLRDSSGAIINHFVTYASLAAMMLGFGAKNGAITAVETLNVDWVCGQKVR